MASTNSFNDWQSLSVVLALWSWLCSLLHQLRADASFSSAYFPSSHIHERPRTVPPASKAGGSPIQLSREVLHLPLHQQYQARFGLEELLEKTPKTTHRQRIFPALSCTSCVIGQWPSLQVRSVGMSLCGIEGKNRSSTCRTSPSRHRRQYLVC